MGCVAAQGGRQLESNGRECFVLVGSRLVQFVQGARAQSLANSSLRSPRWRSLDPLTSQWFPGAGGQALCSRPSLEANPSIERTASSCA
jgi:hypothetical protein